MLPPLPPGPSAPATSGALTPPSSSPLPGLWAPAYAVSEGPSPGLGPPGIILVVLLVVFASILGFFLLYFDGARGASCNDPLVYCPLGPSAATPLGTAFSFGNQSVGNVSAGTNARPGCSLPLTGSESCDELAIGSVDPGISTADLTFELWSSPGATTAFKSVTLLDAAGNGVAQFVTATGWVPCTVQRCGAPPAVEGGLPAILSGGQTLVLDGGSSASLRQGFSGLLLVAIGNGPFEGTVPVVLD